MLTVEDFSDKESEVGREIHLARKITKVSGFTPLMIKRRDDATSGSTDLSANGRLGSTVSVAKKLVGKL